MVDVIFSRKNSILKKFNIVFRKPKHFEASGSLIFIKLLARINIHSVKYVG